MSARYPRIKRFLLRRLDHANPLMAQVWFWLWLQLARASKET